MCLKQRDLAEALQHFQELMPHYETSTEEEEAYMVYYRAAQAAAILGHTSLARQYALRAKGSPAYASQVYPILSIR